MKEKLLNAIEETPGCRATTLAWLVGENKLNVIDMLHKLEDAGLVCHKMYRDSANMEYYDKWYIKNPKEEEN